MRDRFGIKPLYGAETTDGLVFGSELKVLFADPAVAREMAEATGAEQEILRLDSTHL